MVKQHAISPAKAAIRKAVHEEHLANVKSCSQEVEESVLTISSAIRA